MKLSIIFILVFLILTACAKVAEPKEASAIPPASPSVTTATPGPLSQRKQIGSFFAINEVGLGPESFVALTNFTDVPVSLEGLYLCQGSACAALPGEVVEGGKTVRVVAGAGQGLEDVIATHTAFGELRPADGEMALFTSEDTSDAKSLLVYLQWGSTPHELTALAVEYGLWRETSYAPCGPNGTRLFRVEESGLWLWE
jgi:hypothetical protein